jgi:hypothetical protein
MAANSGYGSELIGLGFLGAAAGGATVAANRGTAKDA